MGGPCRGCDLSVIEGDQLLAARQRDLAKVACALPGRLPALPAVEAAFLRNVSASLSRVDVTHGSTRDTIEHCRACHEAEHRSFRLGDLRPIV